MHNFTAEREKKIKEKGRKEAKYFYPSMIAGMNHKQKNKEKKMEIKMGVEDLHTSLLEASGAAE